jgi:hypothetical protein
LGKSEDLRVLKGAVGSVVIAGLECMGIKGISKPLNEVCVVGARAALARRVRPTNDGIANFLLDIQGLVGLLKDLHVIGSITITTSNILKVRIIEIVSAGTFVNEIIDLVCPLDIRWAIAISSRLRGLDKLESNVMLALHNDI